MILTPQPWSCLPMAWSHVIQWPYWAIIKAIGHDGSEVVWPEQSEPYCRRAFHPQELIYLGDRFGFVATMFEPQPVLVSGGELVIKTLHEDFEKIVKNSDGVFTGRRMDGHRHAVAWIKGEVIDSNIGSTHVESLEDFQIQAFFRIKSKWWPS